MQTGTANKAAARGRGIRRTLGILAAFCAASMLAMPALAQENEEPRCGLDHTHAPGCFAATTAAAETAGDGALVLHTHDALCYDADGNLICPMEELQEHTHEEDCYEAVPQETLPDQEPHVHTPDCYTTVRGALICTAALPQVHVHTDDCFAPAVQEEAPPEPHEHTDACYSLQRGELTCVTPELPGHTHTDNCYVPGEELICGKCEGEDHTHDDSCYSKVLVCQTPESEGHAHGDDCYAWTEVCTCTRGDEAEKTEPEQVLICTEPDHLHGPGCYETGSTLICGKKEGEDHTHTDSCYESVLVCTLPGIEGHFHTDSCYRWETILTCGKGDAAQHTGPALICTEPQVISHVHDENCYETDESGEAVLTCTQQEVTTHQHTEDCLVFSADHLICGKSEGEDHTHTYSCYSSWSFRCLGEEPGEAPAEEPTEEPAEELTEEPTEAVIEEPVSDPKADVEWRKDWEKTFAHVELSGAWPHDLLSIAGTQLGYEESERNFYLSEEGKQYGYTRYGHWYGVHYGDWCAMFASFCLNYADVGAFPMHCNCARWIDCLQESEQYAPADTCSPRPGDLVFFDYGRKSQSAAYNPASADHVGIVTEVIPGTREEPTRMVTIEGNYDDRVCYVTRRLDDPIILGYGQLPDGPAAVYSCGREAHSHDETCFDEEGNLCCPTPIHIHNETCRSRKLQFADETLQVEVTLTNAVYVPENLSLRAEPVSQADDPLCAAMLPDVEKTLSADSRTVTDARFFRLKLTAAGQPYELPLGVQAQVQISFAEPVFGPVTELDAPQLYTAAMLEAPAKAEDDAYQPYDPEDPTAPWPHLTNLSLENTDTGIAGARFTANHISDFALVLTKAREAES